MGKGKGGWRAGEGEGIRGGEGREGGEREGYSSQTFTSTHTPRIL